MLLGSTPILTASPLFGGGWSSGTGTSAATFLDMGFGARAVGMGEAYVAAADDVAAAHYNPAGFALPAGPGRKGAYEGLLSQSLLIQDVKMVQAAFARRPFAVSLTRLSVGDIERRTSETIDPEGTFGASDLMLGVSGAWKVAGIGLGATGKLVREEIGGDSASAFAADLGALKRFESRPVSVGLSVANLGSKIRFIDQAAPLPAVIRAGVVYGLTEAFPHALALQVDLPRDSGPVLRLGVEYSGFGPMSIRMGYRSQSSAQRGAALGKALGSTTSGLSDFYGASIGIGLRSPFGTLDYALTPYGELGLAHRLAFSHRFGGDK